MTVPHPNDLLVRDILQIYRLKPRHVGLVLAIDGHAYRRRQKNRAKRRRR